MSVSIQTVEFERRQAHLSELADEPPYTVNGVALGAGDVTVGQSGIKKLWPASALKESAETLEGTNLVVDHNNDSSGVVGQVTKAGYKDDVGVIYEAELFDEELAEKIDNGLLEVSIRGRHMDVEEMDENDDGAKVVEDIEFDNLSIVPTGAAPSNSIEMGETEELSAAQLSQFTEDLDSTEELAEIEPGMWVEGDDMRGITISAIEDGEVEVDIYEESDDKWRSIGETEMVSVDSLDPWDVDEEEDIGAQKDDDEDEEEMAAIDDKVTWGSSGGPAQGIVRERKTDGCFSEKIDGDQKICADDDDPVVLIEIVKDGEPTGTMVAHKESTVNSADFEMEARYDDYPEAASENAQMALDARDETDNPNDCGTDVGWKRANQLANGEGLSREQVGKMSAFNRHRSNSEMDDDEGKSDCGWMMWKAWGGDEGVDWAQRKLDEIEEASIEGEEERITSDKDKKDLREQSPERYINEEELQDYEMHTPDWSGTTESDWSSPDMEDFDTDDLSDIADHFLISATGFPPENFGDLKLPVVEPNGDLSRNALAAVKGGRGVSAVDGLSDDMEERIVEWVNSTANEEFDENWGEDEEEAAMKRPRTIDDTGEEETVDDTGPVEVSLNLINKYLRIEGNHERDSVDKMLSWLFGTTDLPLQTVDDFRATSSRFLEETPGTDSFAGMTVEQFRDWLLMHGGKSKGQREMRDQQRGELPTVATPVHVLTGDDFWQVGKSRESELDDATNKVINMTDEIEEKIAELNEPVAVEQGDLEELQEKADRFEEMSDTLESLKERTDILDDVDREQVEELAESDEPVVVESARFEALSDEAEQVKAVYAAGLADESPAFDAEELTDRFSIEELREKYEEQIGDPEEELTADPEPKSGDVEEEELEERAEEESEEELEDSETDEAEQMREQLRNKIRSGR